MSKRARKLQNLVRPIGLGVLVVGALCSTGVVMTRAEETPAALGKFSYPKPRKSDHVDLYHDVKVPDPYRWLEDPDSSETRAWVEAENKVTFGFLESIPEREPIKGLLTKLWNYERYGSPSREGPRYVFAKNNGLQNQSVLYTLDRLEGEPSLLLDPNTLSKSGTVALAGVVFSEDGSKMAYGLASAGSDWNQWKVMDVATREDLSDQIDWMKFSSVSWRKDGSGFFYSRYPEPDPKAKLEALNYHNKLYYHKLGTPQSQDALILERPDQKEWMFAGHVSDDGRYLIVTISKGTDDKYRILFKDLQAGEDKFVELIDNFEFEYTFIDNDGPVFWFKTNNAAPRGRIIAIDTRNPKPEHWVELVPQAAETLNSTDVVNQQFVTTYLKDAHTQVKVFDLKGRFVREIALPGLGTAGGFEGKRSETETFYSYTSFTTPATIYRLDLTTGESSVFRQPKVDFRPEDFTTEQVFYPSKDGTKIPMFISYKKGMKRDGGNPTVLYGYGGFNISQTPAFSVGALAWMKLGGVYAVANLRGGGEYGEDWHQLGTKLKKQNVFNDFIAAAEFLSAEKYTRSEKLAIMGGSNGGLLVGACMTQRPELFAAALPAVGVMDMLRFHKFTIGHAWVDDYGSSDDAEQFKALLAYSPLHNLKPGQRYPSTMITTADHDDRVVPAHSFKFAASLQEAHVGDNPVLIRIETQAGHGAGKPTSKLIEEVADRWAFLVKVLGVKVPTDAF